MSFTESLEEIVEKNENGLLGAHPTWERVRLGDICGVQNGFAFPSSGFKQDAGTPLLRIRDVLKTNTEVRYDGEFDPMYLVEPGDLVVGMDGDFRCALWKGSPSLLNQRVCRLLPNESLYNKRFLAHVLQGYLSAINAKTSAVTVKHLSSKTVADIPLPLPSLAEQCRVAEQLDETTSDLGAAVAGLERAQRNLKRYRASVLQAAVDGRLVSTEAELARQEDREYEPAKVLLDRILAERRRRWEEAALEGLKAKGKPPTNDKWKTKYKEPVAPLVDELPELPEGWCWTALGEAFEVAVGATPKRSVKRYWAGEIPWVSSGEVAFCRIADTRETITQEGLDNTSTRLHPEGTVLIGMIGEGKTRGQTAILDIAACNNQNSAAIRVSEAGLPPEFVYYYLMSQYEKNRALGSGNNQPALNKSRVQAIPLPLPPLAEQRRIASEVARLLSIAEEIERTIQESILRAGRLRESVLALAFSGRLVSQDNADEPASKLLERIREQQPSASCSRAAHGRSARKTA